jgi:hypothetical protein
VRITEEKTSKTQRILDEAFQFLSAFSVVTGLLVTGIALLATYIGLIRKHDPEKSVSEKETDKGSGP